MVGVLHKAAAFRKPCKATICNPGYGTERGDPASRRSVRQSTATNYASASASARATSSPPTTRPIQNALDPAA